MPVNNWIPVAQQFGQFLGQQSDRRRKLMQRSMMQQLPSYIAGELSGAKSQEDVYKKLPELSARMFAIDPEIGAYATQIANQYGQMKLAQMREIEEDTQAAQTLNMVKDTFGAINVMDDGKVNKLANVIDRLSPSMKPKDLLRMTDYMMKGQVKEQQIPFFDEKKGKHTLKIYKMGPQGVMGDAETYDIVNGALDNPKTKEFENKPIDPEAAKIISRFNESQFERKQSLQNQYAYANYSNSLRKDDDLKERKAIPLLLTNGKNIMGTVGSRIMDQIDPDNPTKKMKIKVQRFFDNAGNDITDQVELNKVYKDNVVGEDWKDARQKANDSANQLMTLVKKAGLYTEDRLKAVLEKGGWTEGYNRTGNLDKISYPSDRFQMFNATSSTKDKKGIISEILASPTLTEEEKTLARQLWNKYWEARGQWMGSPSQQQGTKPPYNPTDPTTW